MLRSMTAYGRSSATSAAGNFIVEVQTINRKHLEVMITLPKELNFLEKDVRGWVESEISRGKVSVRIQAAYGNQIPLSVTPNLPLARQVKSAWEEIARDLDVPLTSEQLFRSLMREQDLLLYNESFEGEEEFRSLASEAVAKALRGVLAMKESEGRALYEDFSQRLKLLQTTIAQIAGASEGSCGKYQEKLKAKLEEALGGAIENEERILRELCVYADKVDISEEVTRFSSHLQQFREVMDNNDKAVGKTLEFITQEMLREINTIGAKSSEMEISKMVIETKGEIERIREQVQNVE